MHSRCTIGIYTYCICLTNWPREPFGMPDDYMMTESNSWECRSLLETYSKHVRFLGVLRENFETSTEVFDLEKPSPLPIQIHWMAFSSLLAQYFLSKYSSRDFWPDRKTSIAGFVRQIERKGKACRIIILLRALRLSSRGCRASVLVPSPPARSAR
jgi:hypothetical protein